MQMEFESQSFSKRLISMLKVDLRRMFTTKLFYIIFAIVLVMPIVILIMTSMMDGSIQVDPQTGVETVVEGFKNTWQIIATTSSDSSSMSMDLTSMCNINMLYFIVAVFICIFVSQDFKSGYAKILFTRRSKKGEYIISQFFVGFIGGLLMILAWLIGAVIGGAISGLSFDLTTAGVQGLVMCLIAKGLLMSLFVSIFLLISVIFKQKLWMSITGSLIIGMLFYMMVPMMTPLDSGITNVFLCLVGGIIFSVIFGIISNKVLKKIDLV